MAPGPAWPRPAPAPPRGHRHGTQTARSTRLAAPPGSSASPGTRTPRSPGRWTPGGRPEPRRSPWAQAGPGRDRGRRAPPPWCSRHVRPAGRLPPPLLPGAPCGAAAGQPSGGGGRKEIHKTSSSLRINKSDTTSHTHARTHARFRGPETAEATSRAGSGKQRVKGNRGKGLGSQGQPLRPGRWPPALPRERGGGRAWTGLRVPGPAVGPAAARGLGASGRGVGGRGGTSHAHIPSLGSGSLQAPGGDDPQLEPRRAQETRRPSGRARAGWGAGHPGSLPPPPTPSPGPGPCAGQSHQPQELPWRVGGGPGAGTGHQPSLRSSPSGPTSRGHTISLPRAPERPCPGGRAGGREAALAEQSPSGRGERLWGAGARQGLRRMQSAGTRERGQAHAHPPGWTWTARSSPLGAEDRAAGAWPLGEPSRPEPGAGETDGRGRSEGRPRAGSGRSAGARGGSARRAPLGRGPPTGHRRRPSPSRSPSPRRPPGRAPAARAAAPLRSAPHRQKTPY